MSKIKKILLIAVPLAIALIVGGFVAMTFLAPPADPNAPVPTPTMVPDPSPGQHGPMLPLSSRVVNLPPGGPYRYVKIAVTIELRPHDAAYYTAPAAGGHGGDELHAEYAAMEPALYDAIGRVVSHQTAATLALPEGRAKLKDELLEEMRHILGEHEVLDIYLTDLVMQ